MMGSGGMVVLDESNCIVNTAKFFVEISQTESCGKCTPCRIGTKRMLKILQRITAGQGKEGDLDLLEELAQYIRATSLCGLGMTAPNPVLSTLRYFRDEYEQHVRKKKCPAAVCRDLITYSVLGQNCTGCGACRRACPADAIRGIRKKPHRIDQELCIKCGTCSDACKFNAIMRA
jgi:NAD-dependent dihydropyrimidine dehydrogenase PreA subunit